MRKLQGDSGRDTIDVYIRLDNVVLAIAQHDAADASTTLTPAEARQIAGFAAARLLIPLSARRQAQPQSHSHSASPGDVRRASDLIVVAIELVVLATAPPLARAAVREVVDELDLLDRLDLFEAELVLDS